MTLGAAIQKVIQRFIPAAITIGSTVQEAAILIESSADGLTAHAGGGQANALLLTSCFNRVTVVGTAADSVKLPPALAGQSMIVENADAADSMNVFPSSGESINALGADAAFAVAANKRVLFFCAKTGVWGAIVTA